MTNVPYKFNPENYAIIRIGAQEIMIAIPDDGEVIGVTHYRKEATNGGDVTRQKAYALNLTLKGCNLVAA